MPGVREVLQFVLEADSSGAVKGFEAVAKASDKHLGDSEKSASNLGSTLTKVGAVAAGAGIAMAAALVGTVKTFEKAEASAAKLDTAVSGMGSKIDTKAIHQLAFELQQVSTATDNQIVAAARWGAVYGLSTNQLKTLLRAAVDLSAQTGQSIDATTKALARAASGGSDKVLVKWGVQLDETARKADAFGTTVAASMAFAGGAAEKQANTFSGQLTRMGNNWTDVKEQIGAGANEVFEPMAKAAADLSEKVASLNPELLKTAGHFTAIGSIATTAFGGLAGIAGQVANLREGFAGAGGVLDKFNLKLTQTGTEGAKSLTGLGKAVAGVGIAAAVVAGVDILAGAINSVNDVAGKASNALDDLTLAASKPSPNLKAVGKSFSELAQNEKDTVRLSKAWEQWGTSIQTSMSKAAQGGKDTNQAFLDQQVTIEDAQRALDKLSPDKALVALDALQKTTNEITANSDQRKANQRFIDDNRAAIEKHAKATKADADSTGEATKAVTDWGDALKGTNGPLGLYAIGAANAEAATKGFADAAEGMDSDELVTGAVKLGDAFHGVEDSIKNLPKNFDETKAALGGYNENQTKAISAVTDWGDAAKGQIQTLIASGASTQTVVDKSLLYVNALKSVMGQAGLTADQQTAYLQKLGLTPEQVLTEIKLSGDAEAKFKLGFLQGQMDMLSKPVQAQVTQHIIMGDYQGALAIAQANMQKQANNNPISQPVKLALSAAAASFKMPGWGGTTMMAPTGLTAGPHAAAPAAWAAPMTNITVNLPAGSTPATTLSAIRRYQRLGGDMGGLLDTVAAIR